jgi:hypothetical protein
MWSGAHKNVNKFAAREEFSEARIFCFEDGRTSDVVDASQ